MNSHKVYCDLKLIQSLEWKRFQQTCVNYFTLAGYRLTFDSGHYDHRKITLVIENNNQQAFIFCSSEKVIGVANIRVLCGMMSDRGISQGAFYSAGFFSKKAVEFAAHSGSYSRMINVDDRWC